MQIIFQGNAKNIQNQQFYRSTVKAIEAQQNAATEEAVAKVQPKPAVPEVPKPEAPEAPPEKSRDDGDQQEMQDIPIAGRTKMTVPKNKDNAPNQEQAPAVDEFAEAKEELNGILKRSPSMCYLRFLLPVDIGQC